MKILQSNLQRIPPFVEDVSFHSNSKNPTFRCQHNFDLSQYLDLHRARLRRNSVRYNESTYPFLFVRKFLITYFGSSSVLSPNTKYFLSYFVKKSRLEALRAVLKMEGCIAV